MQITITLRITGEFLDPDEITKILRVNPRFSGKKGSPRFPLAQKKIISKFGFWTWKSEDLSNAMKMSDHIELLKITFEHAHNLFTGLPNVEHAWVNICVFKSDDDEGDSSVEFILDAKSAVAIGEIGLPIEFSIYGDFRNEEGELPA